MKLEDLDAISDQLVALGGQLAAGRAQLLVIVAPNPLNMGDPISVRAFGDGTDLYTAMAAVMKQKEFQQVVERH